MKSVADICYLPIDGPSLPQALALPKALGYDAAGTIGRDGAAGSGFRSGERVASRIQRPGPYRGAADFLAIGLAGSPFLPKSSISVFMSSACSSSTARMPSSRRLVVVSWSPT